MTKQDTKFKLTKSKVDSLPFVAPNTSNNRGNPIKQIDYFDAVLPGFGVRVSAKTKTYFVMGRVNGKLSRVKLGTHGILTADEARSEAKDKLNALNRGQDINKLRSRERAAKITLAEVLDKYVEDKTLRPNTVLDYRKVIRLYVSDWLKKPMIDITSAMIEARHKKIKTEIGPIPANKLARYLRLLFNYAIKSPSIDLDLEKHPVVVEWGQEKRRRTFLNASELPVWVQAVKRLSSSMMQDYFMMLLYTGIRKNEALTLKWANVNLDEGYFVVFRDDAKNHEDLALPVTEQMAQIFERRAAERENDYVFPGIGKKGHFVEPHKQVLRIQEIAQMILNEFDNEKDWNNFLKETPIHNLRPGVSFCNHDLRRTFSSIAEALVSYSQLKRLLNHSTKSDVTAGYIIFNVEKLRVPAQSIADEIDALSKRKNGKVIPFRRVLS